MKIYVKRDTVVFCRHQLFAEGLPFVTSFLTSFSSRFKILKILKPFLTFSLDCTSLSLSIVYHKKTQISIDKLVNVTAFLLYNRQKFVQNRKFFFTFTGICDRMVVLGVL